jgi:serine/threonine protein kinase/tetratricopeptide (TPR) repeat protein
VLSLSWVDSDPQPIDLTEGEVIEGKYQIERLLGVGGMGAVYVAQRLALHDRVAIKSILASQNTATNRARFLREARAAAAIRHPNVVQVFDFGEPPGRPPYMVMEFLEGPTLAIAVRDGGALSLARALWVLSGVCAAVEAGHRRGVIHRDLKPGNVMLARSDDGRETVKVLDFGLARILENADALPLTNPGSMIGTASYLAPELVDASMSASAATDIYALGVLLYEMVTGRSPFRAETDAATLMRIVSGEYVRPMEAAPHLPAEVCAGIEAALSRDPTLRPRSPEELAARVGAPLAQSGAHGDLLTGRLRRAGPETSAVGRPSELEASMASFAGFDLGEVTSADSDTPNLDGGERTMNHGSAPSAAALSNTFVGRAAELETLRREYRRALDGRGRVIVISGSAGVGKTKLAESFAQWVEQKRGVRLRGRFFAYEGDHPPPYETFLWMLSQESSSVGARPGKHPGGGQAGRDKWQTFSELARAFVHKANGRPMLLTLDDLQWATALDLEFLAYLSRALEDDVVLVTGTARTEGGDGGRELDRWLTRLGSQRALATIRLRGFETGELRAWFQASFPGIRVRPHDIRRLHNATSGNPYYLVEVVSSLVDDRTIRHDEHGWVCAPLDNLHLPETVQSVVQAKLSGLDPELRDVLETACVIGEEFRVATLASAIDLPEKTLERRLEEGVTLSLLSEEGLSPGSDYRFETTTLRSVLYAELGRRRRRRLHENVVAAIGRQYAGHEPDRIAKVLAYHHHAVGDHDKTLDWATRAAIETLARHDHDHAEVSLERAVEALTALRSEGRKIDPLVEPTLDLLTGKLYVRIGRLDEAEERLRHALRDLLPDTHASLRLDVLLVLAECRLARGELLVGLETGEEALLAAGALGDTHREHEARLQAAKCAAPHGHLDRATALLDAIVADERPEHASLRAIALAELAWVHAKRGQFDRAMALTHEAKHIARRCGDLMAEYRAVSVQGLTQLESGDQEAAITRLEQALELARGLSLRRREGVELHNLGECYYFLERYDEALARSRQALAIFLEIHDRATEGDCRVNIGRTLMAQGNLADALQMLMRGRELASTAGRGEYEGLALLELGLADVDAGRLESATENLQRAHQLFAVMDSLYLWRAELGLAKAARAAGEHPLAAVHVARAAELVEQQRARLGSTLNQEHFSRSVAELQTFSAPQRR